ncbi:alpha/beta hydrolase [Streptomyces sp. NPDC056519]|uniref:alpha/beta hydrolase n=1 Tax=Streptomyces sp. NPDC056519 TaxID=3345849 RepID=UPI0036ADCE53
MRRMPLVSGLAVTTFVVSLPLLSAGTASAFPDSGYTPGAPVWARCSADEPANYECATLKVPLDYEKPQGRMIDLAISRIKSPDPSRRHGVMLFNPGGPGTSGRDLPLFMDKEMNKDVRDQYDLIGFDPRGVGASSPVTCGLTDSEQNIDRGFRPETFSDDVAWARTVADKCRAKAGDVLPYITTRNTARDMDTIRAALGEEKISYLGYSYGTYLGAVYTQMFPQRSDRFVLDSSVDADPGTVWRGMFWTWATETEPAFARWTKWTAERADQYQLGSTPEEVSATLWALVARADKEPIDMGGQKITGGTIRGMRQMYFYPQWGATMIKSLKDAADGKASKATLPPGPAQLDQGKSSGETPSDNGRAAAFAVFCGDSDRWPRDPKVYEKEAAKAKTEYPVYGDMAANIKPCAFWDKPLEPATKITLPSKVLIVQNEWDAQTPLAGAQGMHRTLKGSKMITALNGEGHGVYVKDPASCVNAPVNAYLTTGRLPSQDITCQNTDQTRSQPKP